MKDLVEKYGLTVSDAKKAVLDDLFTAGTAAQNKTERDDAIEGLFEKVEFEKADEGYGYYEYSAVVENTTDFNFKDADIVLALYDQNDVKAAEAYANAKTWEKGEKVRFETGSDVDATRVKVTVDYYSVDE